MANLTKMTKAELMAQNPNIGLSMSMTKEQIIGKIEEKQHTPKTGESIWGLSEY